MKKLKVMTVVGTRPEIIRLSCVIKELQKFTSHTLVHTGQNYDFELNEIFFNDLGLKKPNVFLNASGKTSIESIGNIISSIEAPLKKYRPDVFLVLGDTNSCMSAISAKKMKIPVFHMEAGNRCFDQRVPEEINRKIVDVVADINLPYSEISREYLIKENFPPERVIKTGSPIPEVIFSNLENINQSKILDKLSLKEKNYFLLSCHREENVDTDKMLNRLVNLIKDISSTYNKKILFSVHPRTKARLRKLKVRFPKNVILHKPFGYFDYVKLQCESIVTLSDSGTITEESSILNFPALNIREAHERPEGMEEGSVIMTGLNSQRVMQALKILASQARNKKRDLHVPNDYKSLNVSKKVLRVIHSYVDFVRQKVWLEMP